MTVPGQNFLLADLTGIVRYSNLGATFRQLEANELWISTTADGPARRDLLNRLDNVPGYTSTSIHDRRALLAQSRADPLVMAGWRSLLFVAFSAVLVLSCLGFIVHAYVSFQDRRLQFALLRTVGFSWGQLAGMLWFEQTLVIAAGMALGAWMGGRLGAIIMPFLGRDDFGAEVLPPFAMEVNWGALLIVYALLLAAFAAITMAVVWVLRREALQQIFRMGGET
jgi:putative ABC transport system permease protein